MTLPQWSLIDKSMRKQADYRLWCLTKPIGYFKPYRVRTSFDTGEVTTDGYEDVQRIRFPNLDKQRDPHYIYLAEKKDELLNSGAFDADMLEDDEAEPADPKEIKRERDIQIAQNARNEGFTTVEIAKMTGYSQSWVSQNTNAVTGD